MIVRKRAEASQSTLLKLRGVWQTDLKQLGICASRAAHSRSHRRQALAKPPRKSGTAVIHVLYLATSLQHLSVFYIIIYGSASK